ncbi:MAG: hypothetical protein WCI88_00045 [Chloroflexota bacterium]
MSDFFEFAEHTYLRLQAGDLLTRCLEQDNLNPIQEMVEELILSGPKSISVLREILVETEQRRANVQDSLHKLFVDFQNQHQQLKDFPNILAFVWMPAEICLEGLIKHGMSEVDAQMVYSDIIRKNRKNILDLTSQLNLLKDVQNYLHDWLWGMAYQSFHQAHPYIEKGSSTWIF